MHVGIQYNSLKDTLTMEHLSIRHCLLSQPHRAVYKSTSELGTPLYTGQPAGSQWLPLHRSTTDDSVPRTYMRIPCITVMCKGTIMHQAACLLVSHQMYVCMYAHAVLKTQHCALFTPGCITVSSGQVINKMRFTTVLRSHKQGPPTHVQV